MATYTSNPGDDTLSGGVTDDIYQYNLGTGNDLITDTGGTDTLIIDDTNNLWTGKWNISRSGGSNMLIDFNGVGSVTVQGQFAAATPVIDVLTDKTVGGLSTSSMVWSVVAPTKSSLVMARPIASSGEGVTTSSSATRAMTRFLVAMVLMKSGVVPATIPSMAVRVTMTCAVSKAITSLLVARVRME